MRVLDTKVFKKCFEAQTIKKEIGKLDMLYCTTVKIFAAPPYQVHL